ncbi:dTDP-4-dehydrorhamnose 3,5-epimerase family protein [Variovorax sp. EL159]|uniref:dTDP-4-dehydrorhamnose 3,5-epimerase family protein n=1 Tax=Variovorax sp. EL159 TaxID=1566270 RepID=UPI00088DA248|nr:dTDP-4-dehydrorhamnose 3,5-epimerase family protein [Variovorax sp. EL159]SCX38742.1 dTDP-4-dehydrorhamnose 3,5-epimerase [Variovorax sp. EL159]
MARFGIDGTPLAGLLRVQRQKLEDSRGFFSRFFCAEELAATGFDKPIAQINHTLTRRRGSVRGLHFQHPPHAEDKLVSCLQGEIFDVAIDLRQGSPTFLHWHGEVLSAENARSLLIPKGFAHGFQTLSDDAELLYLHSVPYVAAAEGALNARDPALAIEWPLAFADISERDALHPFVSPDFTGLAA